MIYWRKLFSKSTTQEHPTFIGYLLEAWAKTSHFQNQPQPTKSEESRFHQLSSSLVQTKWCLALIKLNRTQIITAISYRTSTVGLKCCLMQLLGHKITRIGLPNRLKNKQTRVKSHLKSQMPLIRPKLMFTMQEIRYMSMDVVLRRQLIKVLKKVLLGRKLRKRPVLRRAICQPQDIHFLAQSNHTLNIKEDIIWTMMKMIRIKILTQLIQRSRTITEKNRNNRCQSHREPSSKLTLQLSINLLPAHPRLCHQWARCLNLSDSDPFSTNTSMN